jgi:ABC-type Zn2+ transport system substrate-binding protein/surface adhesin
MIPGKKLACRSSVVPISAANCWTRSEEHDHDHDKEHDHDHDEEHDHDHDEEHAHDHDEEHDQSVTTALIYIYRG